tara:strand:+ start:9138 stop:9725 length:588 start_codon:yes stop_codon:yes gene_type:complete
MSKKALLSEATLRRFMKLANVGSDQVIDTIMETYNEGMYGRDSGAMYARDDEEEEGPEEDAPDLDVDADVEDMGELPGDEGPEDAMDVPAEAPSLDLSQEDVRQIVDGFAQVMSDLTGFEVSAEDDGAMDEPVDELPPMDDEEPEGDDMPAEGGDDELEMPLEEVEEGEDARIDEVARRVIERILAAKQKKAENS